MVTEKSDWAICPHLEKCLTLTMRKRVAQEVREFLAVNEMIELVDIDWLNKDKLYHDEADQNKVYEYFVEKKVDAVFNVVCAFGAELSVCRIAKNSTNLFSFGVLGTIIPRRRMEKRNSQCGALATSKSLVRFDIPFSFIVSSALDSETFKNGFENFVRTANVIKKFGNLKIGQIDTRPKTFMSVMVNESELLERFGIQIVPCSLVNITDVALKMVEEQTELLDKEIEEYKKEVCTENITQVQLRNIMALKHAIKDFAVREGCSVVAMHCWHEVEARLGISACASMGMVSDEDIPVVCETDIHGAISAAIAGAATMGKARSCSRYHYPPSCK